MRHRSYCRLVMPVVTASVVWTDVPPAMLSELCMQAGVNAYGARDEELWLRYAAWMQERKRSTGQVMWRASNALKDGDNFMAQYQAQQQKLAGAGSAPYRASCMRQKHESYVSLDSADVVFRVKY